MVNHTNLASRIECRHLGTNIITNDDNRRQVDEHAINGFAADAMDAIRADTFAERLPRLRIDRPNIGKEVIAARYDFIPIAKVFWSTFHTAFCTAIGLLKFRLKNLPLNLDFIRLTVAPVTVIGVLWVIRNQIAELNLAIVMGRCTGLFDPAGWSKFEDRSLWRRRDDDGLDLCRDIVYSGYIIKGWRGDIHGPCEDKIACSIILEPAIFNACRSTVKANAKVFTAEVNVRIDELVAIRWQNRSGRDRGVRHPATIRVFAALVAHENLWMEGIREVFRNLRRAVVVVVVGIRNIAAICAIDFDFKPVALAPGVIDGIEVVDASVRLAPHAKHREATGSCWLCAGHREQSGPRDKHPDNGRNHCQHECLMRLKECALVVRGGFTVCVWAWMPVWISQDDCLRCGSCSDYRKVTGRCGCGGWLWTTPAPGGTARCQRQISLSVTVPLGAARLHRLFGRMNH